MSFSKNKLAGIEYAGLPGISRECQYAVMRLLQFGDYISMARILTSPERHCILLTVGEKDLVAIKSGFGSGYSGEGPRRFSYTLQLLDAHKVDIEEYEVEDSLIKRLDDSSLTTPDIEKIKAARPVRPTHWHDYIFEKHLEMMDSGDLWKEFRPVMPFGIIDNRIFDLAISFWEGPDDKLLKGYRRLESIVHERTGIDEHGAKLFAKAFQESSRKLQWESIDEAEQAARGSLFSVAFRVHRNPRAHREMKDSANSQLSEFLLLNHLYTLEKESVMVKQESE